MNNCVFIGRTTENVELRYTQDNLAIGNFILAVDDGYGEKKHTSFFRFTIFGKSAENMNKHATKGTKIAVECKARQDTWIDKNGNKRGTVGFVVNEWEFAQSKIDNPGKPVAQDDSERDKFMKIPEDIDEELPFI